MSMLARRLAALGIGVASVLDASVLLRLLNASNEPPAAVRLLATHAALSAMTAGALARALARPAARFVVVAAALGLFVPVTFPLFVAVAFLAPWPRATQEVAKNWHLLPTPKDVRPLAPVAQLPESRIRARRRIAEALGDKGAAASESRLEALMRAHTLSVPIAVGFYKQALLDPSDDVRLYAFSRLERLRDQWHSTVERLARAADTATPAQRPALELRVAEAALEICRLGLADGAVRDHFLGRAAAAAERAAKVRFPPSDAQFLLGRIALQRHQFGLAQHAFEGAVANGYPRSRALPWLAECAFRKRQFDEVVVLQRSLSKLTFGQTARRSSGPAS